LKRVVVFRNGSIGNTLVAVPLMRALKRKLGVEHLAVVVDPVGKSLLAGLSFIDELIVYDRRGADGGIKGTLKLICKLRSSRFDCALLAKRFFRNEMISFLSGIPRRIGFTTPGKKPFRLTDTVPYIQGKNIIELNLDLLTPFGLENVDDSLEIAVCDGDRAAAQSFMADNGIQEGQYVVCHFGGVTMSEDKWSAEHYGKLCQNILSKYPYRLVFMAPGSEHDFAQAVSDVIDQDMRSRISICSKLSLKASTALIGGARYFLGNDSGPSHLADAAGTPSVILYGDSKDVKSQVEKWKPKGEQFRAVFSEEGVLSALGVDEVVTAFVDLVAHVES
jgi:ADP-heptose:LPS heptosyltransferase